MEALASGKRAATVDCFLRGVDMLSGLEEEPDVFINELTSDILSVERINRRKLQKDEYNNNFQETIQPFNAYEAELESEKCLTCGSRAEITYQEDCQICHLCRIYCPVDAISFSSEKCVSPMVGWG